MAIRAVHAGLGLALATVACSGAAGGEATATHEDAVTVPIGVPIQRPPPIVSPIVTQPRVCLGNYVSGAFAIASTWDCPSIAVSGGTLVGTSGVEWLIDHGQYSSDPEMAEYFAVVASVNPTLTPAMLAWSQPFCAYLFREAGGGTSVTDPYVPYEDAAQIQAATNAQAVAPECLPMVVMPGHAPCPSCTGGSAS